MRMPDAWDKAGDESEWSSSGSPSTDSDQKDNSSPPSIPSARTNHPLPNLFSGSSTATQPPPLPVKPTSPVSNKTPSPPDDQPPSISKPPSPVLPPPLPPPSEKTEAKVDPTEAKEYPTEAKVYPTQPQPMYTPGTMSTPMTPMPTPKQRLPLCLPITGFIIFTIRCLAQFTIAIFLIYSYVFIVNHIVHEFTSHKSYAHYKNAPGVKSTLKWVNLGLGTLLGLGVTAAVAGLSGVFGVVGLCLRKRCLLITALVLVIMWFLLSLPFAAGTLYFAVDGLERWVLKPSKGSLAKGFGTVLLVRKLADRIEKDWDCCGSLGPMDSYCSPLLNASDFEGVVPDEFWRDSVNRYADDLPNEQDRDKVRHALNGNPNFNKAVAEFVKRLTAKGGDIDAADLADELVRDDDFRHRFLPDVDPDQLDEDGNPINGNSARQKRAVQVVDSDKLREKLRRRIPQHLDNSKIATVLSHDLAIDIIFTAMNATDVSKMPQFKRRVEDVYDKTIDSMDKKGADKDRRQFKFASRLFEWCLVPKTCCPKGACVPAESSCTQPDDPFLRAQSQYYYAYPSSKGTKCLRQTRCYDVLISKKYLVLYVSAGLNLGVTLCLLIELVILSIAIHKTRRSP